MNLGLPELLFIFVIALLIFGPRKLPEISRQIGRALAEYKRATDSVKWKWEAEVRKLDAAPARHFAPLQNPTSATGAEQVTAGVSEELGSVAPVACPDLIEIETGNARVSAAPARDDTGIEVVPSSPEASDASLQPNCDALLAALQKLPELRTSSTTEKSD